MSNVKEDTLEIGECTFEFVKCKPDSFVVVNVNSPEVFEKEEVLLLRDFINEKFGGIDE